MMKEFLQQLQIKWLTSYKLTKMRKKYFQLIRPSDSPTLIFVFGCQRSGTTLLGKLFGLCPLVNSYSEGERPYFYQKHEPNYLRLRPVEEVKYHFSQEISPFVLLKPLYDSQTAEQWLSAFPGSKGFWIFRHYLDVIDSHIKFYRNQNGVDYIKDYFTLSKTTWKNENLPFETQQFFNKISTRELNQETGYALFWIARNSLYFREEIKNKLYLVKYEDLVQNPLSELSAIYAYVGIPFKKKYAKIVHTNSVKKSVNFNLDEEVKDFCDELYEKLLMQENKG
jgi:hypothetical protein